MEETAFASFAPEDLASRRAASGSESPIFTAKVYRSAFRSDGFLMPAISAMAFGILESPKVLNSALRVTVCRERGRVPAQRRAASMSFSVHASNSGE